MISSRNRLLLVPIAMGALLGFPGEATGQAAITVGVRGGASIPVGSFEEGGGGDGARSALEAGPSFGVDLQYHPQRGSGFFVGFSQHRFGCEAESCPGSGEYVSTGWNLGLRHTLPVGGLRPYLQAGAVLSRTEDGGIRSGGPAGVAGAGQEVSDLALGGEAGAGLDISLGRRFRAQPGVRYGITNTRFSDGLLRMRYLVADLGLRVTF